MPFMQSAEKFAALAISKIPASVAKRLKRKVVVDGQTLDPHLSLVLGANKRKASLESLGPEAARDVYHQIAHMLESPTRVRAATDDQVAETASGPVPIRLYEPSEEAPRPAVIYFHGGGHVIGDLDTHDGFCHRLCQELAATIISVDYRRGPESPFPIAVDDCRGAAQWVVDSASSLGLDPKRVALAGDSAGGNLAAVVSQEVQGIAFQLLIYPGINFAKQTQSKEWFAKGYGLDKTTLSWFLQQYSQGSSHSDPRLSPALSKTLDRSPSTHIATAGFDPLRDEATEYAQLLTQAGVACTIENHESLSHGFIHFTRLPGCEQAVAHLIAALREGLAQPS